MALGVPPAFLSVRSLTLGCDDSLSLVPPVALGVPPAFLNVSSLTLGVDDSLSAPDPVEDAPPLPRTRLSAGRQPVDPDGKRLLVCLADTQPVPLGDAFADTQPVPLGDVFADTQPPKVDLVLAAPAFVLEMVISLTLGAEDSLSADPPWVAPACPNISWLTLGVEDSLSADTPCVSPACPNVSSLMLGAKAPLLG
ncbi:MAG TPA: hypothetical protein V6D22_08550 [Candidatus Obscuribacterales bacterium]